MRNIKFGKYEVEEPPKNETRSVLSFVADHVLMTLIIHAFKHAKIENWLVSKWRKHRAKTKKLPGFYECMHECVHTHTHTHTPTCTHTCTHVYTHVCVQTQARECTHAGTHRHIHTYMTYLETARLGESSPTESSMMIVHTCVHTHTHTHTRVHIQKHMQTHTRPTSKRPD